ncbi:hypothetical protein BGW80DRAFT_47567 [Lactifluus volemus]|nr:hypothetical protein BGW80DRAFT_47567 [Lactifluus volemus]
MMGSQLIPLPPLTIIPGTNLTWESFEHHFILELLRRQPEPTIHEPAEISANNRMFSTQLKALIFQLLSSSQLLSQPANLRALAEAWCNRKVLLWRSFPFNNLPVEIVINIFRFAVWSTLGSPEGILLRFRLTWVCRRWRHIVVHDQTLWNTILFTDFKIGHARSRLFLQRAGTSALDLRIDDNIPSRVTPNQPMTADNMQQLLDTLAPKFSQIRLFIAVIEMWPPILVLLDRLHKSSRSLEQIERIEIHRTGRPYRWNGPGYPLSDYQHALTLCDGRTRRVNSICLNGIHLDWDRCHLSNLTVLDLRRMPPELGPSFERFREMLKSSPNLKKLCLDGAGPIRPPEPAESSHTPVVLPQLESFVLGDFSVEYAVFCVNAIHAPNVHEVTVLNLLSADHTQLIRALTGKFPELLMATLYGLDVPKSQQGAKAVAEWLLSIPKVKFMRMALIKPNVYANFFIDSRLRLRDDMPLIATLEESQAIIGNGPIILCPQLEAIEVQQIDHESVINFAYGRAKDGVPLRKLYVYKEWEERLKPNGRMALQRIGPDLLRVTQPMTMTPFESDLWKQLGEGREELDIYPKSNDSNEADACWTISFSLDVLLMLLLSCITLCTHLLVAIDVLLC